MPILRSEISTPSVYVNKSADGINFVIRTTGSNLLATRRVDGVIPSTDKGLNWGTPFGLAQGGPWTSLFRMPAAKGAAPAGRLMAIKDTAAPANVYVSDDDGATWTAKALSVGILGQIRNHKFVQRTDGAGTGFVYVQGISAGFGHSTDGGDTWGFVNLVTNIANRNSFFLTSAGAMGAIGFRSTDSSIQFHLYAEAVISTETSNALVTIDAAMDTSTVRLVAERNTTDDQVGLAFLLTTGEWRFGRYDITLDSYSQEFTSATGGLIDDVIHIAPLNNRTEGWAVVTHDTNDLYQLWVSNTGAGGSGTFTVHGTLDGGGLDEGRMSNMIELL